MAREVPELDLWDEEVPGLDVREAMARARAGRGGRAEVRQAGDQLRGGDLRAGDGRHGRSPPRRGSPGRYRGTNVSLRGRAGVRRRRGQEAQRLLLDLLALPGGAAGRRGGRAGGGPAHAGQAGLAQGADRRGAGDLLARRRPQRAGPAGRGDVRRGGLAQEQLPGPARGDADRLAADHGGRRSAAARGRPARGPSTARGWPPARNVVVEAGVLRTFLCDTYSARKLERPSTGSAGPRAWAAARTSPRRTSSCGPGTTPAADLEKLDRGASTSPS